jgi:CheY-like chemotaxis protein
MDLEELLVNAYDLGRRVVIVENMGEGVTQVKDAATKLNELTNEVFDRPVSTVIIHPDKFTKSLDGNVMQAIDSQGVLKEMPGINKNDIVLFSGYTPGSFPHLRDVLISMCAMKQMQEKMPNIPSTNYAFVLPSGERGGCLERVWKQVLGLFEGANQEFFEHAVYGPIPQRGASSLVGVLRSEAGVLQHNVGSLRDARFMDALSAQFAKGCNQTSLEKTFLCINEKLKEKKGKFEVISPDAQVDELDFSKYYAGFTDSHFSTARCYNDARNAISNGNYDVVLLDHRMPYENQVELMNRDFDSFVKTLNNVGYSLISLIHQRNPKAVVIGTSSLKGSELRSFQSPDFILEKVSMQVSQDLEKIVSQIAAGGQKE